MKKKGQVSISSIVITTIGIVLLAYLFIPQVQQSTNTFADIDSLSYTRDNSSNTSFTLQYTDIVAGSPSVAGLTLGTNYTYSNSSGTVTILANTTDTGTYTASYNYYSSRYINSTSDRVLFGVLITIAIAGAIYYVARMFGLA